MTQKLVQFVKSAVKPEQYPIMKDPRGIELPEVAVAGRSNVGKSSLINHFLNLKHLAKASSVPGKTQLINFFKIGEEYAIADLPGYGFAKVPSGIRKEWGPMIGNYLEKRSSLKLMLFLLDIRRIPSKEDLTLIEWALFHKRSVLLVLTKSDKLKKSEIKPQCEKIFNVLGELDWPYILYSVKSGMARKELQHAISQLLKGDS
ncbi:MAG: YihA family ribosome biogenesis GTP-binding protein [Parachlamydiales bacterium]|nr:YihA family ribosome biogenesis GTP-binding protein [Parachlamydiales bacterium]